MDIKGISRPALTPVTALPPATVTSLKSADSHPDRDPQGGAYQQAKENEPELTRPLTEEELQSALKKLSSVKGFQAAGLSYRVEKDAQNRHVVLILDPQQNVIKRLNEQQLFSAFILQDQVAERKGSLLNKAA